MKPVHFQIFMDVDDIHFNMLKQLEHHANWLLDLDNWPEIASVYECHVADMQDEKQYLIALNSLVQEILYHQPSIAEEDKEKKELYKAISNVYEVLYAYLYQLKRNTKAGDQNEASKTP